MKKFYILLVMPLLLSCSNDNIENNKIVDNILYYDFNPDSILSSIKGFHFAGIINMYDSCFVPVPRDSVVYCYIDMDQDGTNDFKIYHKHWFTDLINPSPHNWCSAYKNLEIAIKRTSSEVSVNEIYANRGTRFGMGIKNFSVGDTISYDLSLCSQIETDILTLEDYGVIYLTVPNGQISYTPSGEKIIGVTMNKNDSIYCGWISIEPSYRQCIIKDYALNLTPGQFIIAGQKFNEDY